MTADADRGNLVVMGVIPLQLQASDNRKSLGLTSGKTFDIVGRLR